LNIGLFAFLRKTKESDRKTWPREARY